MLPTRYSKHYYHEVHCRPKAWKDSTSGAVFLSRNATTSVDEHLQ